MDSNTVSGLNNLTLSNLTALMAIVGALGTAAFGLVDSFKALPYGGLSLSGFKFIRKVVLKLLPEDSPGLKDTGLSRDSIVHALQSQWINGVDKSSQLNIAKSLIKLRLSPETAPTLATVTGVNADILTQVASNIKDGKALSEPEQTDVYGRFDLLLTTLLDQAYQRADQRYRNVAKFTAIPVAIALSLLAANFTGRFSTPVAVLIGLIATPIAPIAKDISSAITTAAQAFGAKK